jgi:hypothetical protein
MMKTFTVVSRVKTRLRRPATVLAPCDLLMTSLRPDDQRRASIVDVFNQTSLGEETSSEEFDPSTLTEKEKFELRTAFDLFDKDGTGSISSEELRSVICTLGHTPTSKEMEQMVASLDKDGYGAHCA